MRRTLDIRHSLSEFDRLALPVVSGPETIKYALGLGNCGGCRVVKQESQKLYLGDLPNV